MKFYKATLETHSYMFEAYAKTGAQARAAIRMAWQKHRASFGENLWTWAEIKDDVNVDEFEIGQSYRDGKKF